MTLTRAAGAQATAPTSNGTRSAAAPDIRPVAASGVAGTAGEPSPVVVPQRPERVAEQLQAFLRSSNRDVEFRVDADTRANVVVVRDAASGEVVRQMPTEEALRAVRNLMAAQGSLLDTKA